MARRATGLQPPFAKTRAWPPVLVPYTPMQAYMTAAHRQERAPTFWPKGPRIGGVGHERRRHGDHCLAPPERRRPARTAAVNNGANGWPAGRAPRASLARLLRPGEGLGASFWRGWGG